MMAPKKHSNAGFTIVEVLVASLVLGIGLVGILGMQSSASLTNRGAYDRHTAMTLAETTLERMKRDGLEWSVTTAPGDGSWLQHAISDADENWAQPPLPAGASNQPTYNDMMLPHVSNADIPASQFAMAEKNSRYCIEYQIQWVVPGEMARADVRVSYARNREGTGEMGGNCRILSGITDRDRAAWFRSVRITGMIRRNDLGSADNTPG
ncbi:MAG: prepilin-type N-terminal cleavage/methylation domain-containing protein [Bradymonadia bacterium]|jgi:prepilin-type N-terminal cleavage/methylation domain-containing protein